MGAIRRIFSLALKLRNVYANFEACVTSTMDFTTVTTQITSIDTEFMKVHKFLLSVLTTNLQKRPQSHCMGLLYIVVLLMCAVEDMLLRINFNGFYVVS